VQGGRRDIGGDILAQETRVRPAAHPRAGYAAAVR